VKKLVVTGLAHTFQVCVLENIADLKVCASRNFHSFSGLGFSFKAAVFLKP
jgi:hypothetical protein